jgi:hypothetical protein
MLGARRQEVNAEVAELLGGSRGFHLEHDGALRLAIERHRKRDTWLLGLAG